MTVLDIRQRDENTWYYVLDKKGNEGQLHGSKLYDWSQVSEILGEVPSYEEWQAKLEQNAQLKELLKEWVQFEIEENPNDFTVMYERMSELANKTKEVLK